MKTSYYCHLDYRLLKYRTIVVPIAPEHVGMTTYLVTWPVVWYYLAWQLMPPRKVLFSMVEAKWKAYLG